MRDIRRYLTVGAGAGFAAGALEASFVHRPGLPYIPFAAMAYACLFGAGFAALWALARLLRRDLVALGLGLATFLFAGLEVGFWINVRANPFEGATQGKLANLAVLAGSLALGVAVYFLARRRSARIGPWRPVPWVLGVTLVGLAIYFGVASRSMRAAESDTNCLIISLDAVRADHLGIYGYARATSPNIDALARKGVLCERTYTQSPGSTGGHASMLTGLYPLTSGAYLNGFALDPKVETIAEVFAGNGYATAAFIDNWYISPALGFGQGFGCFVDGGKAMILKDAPPPIFFRGLLLYQVIHRSLVPPGVHSDLDVVDAARWIKARRHSRFFVFLHIMDAHSPYLPPRDLVGRFGGSGEALDPAYIQSLHDKSLGTRLTPAENQVLIDRYDEEILSADRKVGAIVGTLDRLGLLEKTVIVLTADHGEMMAEGKDKEFGHGTLDYGCLHIPLVVYAGDRASRNRVPAGRSIATVTQIIDIVPTIVDALGLKDPARRQGMSLLSPEILSGSLARTAFATGDIEARDEYAAITRDWQYVIRGDKLGLYDLASGADPEVNVITEHQAVADSLQASIEAWIKRCIAEAVVPYSLKGRSVTPGHEALQRLKALGYIQ
jgi:Sulfatase